jgi:hypothetical protein
MIVNGGNSDDTPEIQAAVDSGYAEFLPKIYNVTSVNVTNRLGTVIKGCGRLLSCLIPKQSGVNVFDLTGSSNITLESFRISTTITTLVPRTGILNAQRQGDYSSDATTLRDIRIDGHFSLSAWYNLQVASSYSIGSHFYNYQAGCPAVIHTGNNFFGAASQFQTINNANDHTPSDWTFVQNEIHSIGAGQGFWMGGTQSYRYYGGNIASSICPVDMNGVVVSGQVINPTNVIFDGTTFYADFAPLPAVAIRQGAAFNVITRGCEHNGFPLT